MKKMDKYDATIKLLGIATATLLLIPIVAQTPPQVATAQQNSGNIAGPECTDAIADKLNLEAPGLENAKGKAIALAANHKEFVSKSRGYNFAFYGLVTDWSFDADCNLALKNVNVVYRVNDVKGDWLKYIVVTEDPEITKVISVTEQTERVDFSVNYSGYEFWANSGATTSIYEAKASWQVPSVSQPTDSIYGTNACKTNLSPPNPSCWLGIWPGLHKGFVLPPNTDKIAQGGSSGKVTCNVSPCPTEYKLWFQFFPTSSAFFCSTTVSPGNSVTSTVTNQKKNLGGDNTKWNIVVQNDTTGQACATFNFVWTELPEPKLAIFMNERPSVQDCNSQGQCTPLAPATLAKFTFDNMLGTIWYDNAAHSIQDPYNSNFKNKIIMQQSGCLPNIDVGNVVSGTFTQSYLRSCGT